MMSWLSRSGLKRTELTPAEKCIGIIRLSTESLQHLSLVTEEETGERRLHLDCQSAGDWTVAALAWTVQCTVHCTLYCTVSSNTHLHSTVLSTWLHKGTIRDIYQLLLFLLSNLLNSNIPGLTFSLSKLDVSSHKIVDNRGYTFDKYTQTNDW